MQEEQTIDLNISPSPIVRWALITGGTIFVGIGILGIFLPLLPTTVFFLMAAWCYARSSKRFYFWLHNNKYFGKHLKDYREGKGMSKQSKIITLVVLWGGILYSLFVAELIVVRILLCAVAIGVTIRIVTLPTQR